MLVKKWLLGNRPFQINVTVIITTVQVLGSEVHVAGGPRPAGHPSH